MPPKGGVKLHFLSIFTPQLPLHLQKIHEKNERTYFDSCRIALALDVYNFEPHRKPKRYVNTEISMENHNKIYLTCVFFLQ